MALSIGGMGLRWIASHRQLQQLQDLQRQAGRQP